MRLFTAKLQEKKQSLPQRQRAANAVSLYFQMENHEKPEHKNTGASLYAKEKSDNASVKQNPGTIESLVDQTQSGLQPILQNTPHYFRNIARTSNFNEALDTRKDHNHLNGTRF